MPWLPKLLWKEKDNQATQNFKNYFFVYLVPLEEEHADNNVTLFPWLWRPISSQLVSIDTSSYINHLWLQPQL